MAESTDKPVSLVALEEAVTLAGGQSALARAIGKSQGHVGTWLDRGRCAPDVVLAIEAATGVSRHRLREDVFGPSPANVENGEAAA